MINYFTNIFKTYKLLFVFAVSVNAYITLNTICFALFGFTFSPVDIGKGFLQFLIWIITGLIIFVMIDSENYER